MSSTITSAENPNANNGQGNAGGTGPSSTTISTPISSSSSSSSAAPNPPIATASSISATPLLNQPSTSSLAFSGSHIPQQGQAHAGGGDTTPKRPGKPSAAAARGKSASREEVSQRRTSSRSIKRPKFDDELVDSSITKSQRNRQGSVSQSRIPGTPLGSEPPTPSTLGTPGTSSGPLISPITPIDIPLSGGKARPTPKTSSISRKRRHRIAHINAVKDLGRWKPADDMALILGVQQTQDLDTVYRGIKFTCKFTRQELEDRWYALLYDHEVSKIAVAAMRQLHPEMVAQIHSRALFSEAEENLIKSIGAFSQPTLETFEQLLDKHSEVFLPYRTAKSLLRHWTILRHYQLLHDQPTQNLLRNKNMMSFEDAEEIIDKDIASQAALNPTTSSGSGAPSLQLTVPPKDDPIHQEILFGSRRLKREIRQLENEIPKLQVLVDSITGVAPTDFDSQTLAVLRGRLVRYLMRSREITLGRQTKDSQVDVDLSLEGPASKISRKQGLIKMLGNGDFILTNTGKRPFYVDAKPVLSGANSAKLNNNSVVEISGLRFVFLVNVDLIAQVRANHLKTQVM